MPSRFSGAAAASSGSPGVWGPNFGKANELNLATHISYLEYKMVGGLATAKDTWVGHPPACAGEVNHNATNLQVDILAALPKDAWIGFDLTAFPSGASVIAAELTLRLVSVVNLVPPTTIKLSRIADADEGWGETTLQCTGAPAIGAALETGVTLPAAGADLVVTLGATSRSRLQSRLGVGVCTFVANMETALASCVFADKETGPAPSLRMTLTVPT